MYTTHCYIHFDRLSYFDPILGVHPESSSQQRELHLASDLTPRYITLNVLQSPAPTEYSLQLGWCKETALYIINFHFEDKCT